MSDILHPNKNEELEKKLAQARAHGAEDQYRLSAERLGLPFSDLASVPIDGEAISVIPEEAARRAAAAVVVKSGIAITLATINTESPALKELITNLKSRGFKVSVIITSPAGLERAFKRYESVKIQTEADLGSVEINEDELSALQAQIGSITDLKQQVSGISVTKLLEILLAGALKIGASDIHFEPTATAVRLRYRFDGVLQDVTEIDTQSYQKVLNRLKVLGRLKLNIHNSPQDGRFTIRQQHIDIEVRVSVLPSEYGETVVMRLLDPRTIHSSLEDLGMRPDFLEMAKEQIGKPTGAVFTTGPTGAGKTTTLYAFLNFLNSSDSKIITIEDPIEYHVIGVSQTQVDPSKGYTFANGLRAIVRQDPDIVLVGEVRDAETADIALNAALTGHLVLSTLHTNDAAGTIPRLIDLGVKPEVIAPAIRMTMAQRLVRKLCSDCREKQKITPEILDKIKKDLEPIRQKFSLPALDEKIEIYAAKGCEKCNNAGYRGRIGLYEAFLVTREMEQLILSSPSVSAVRDLAIQQGMVTMRQDAYMKLLAGITSFDEIERILG
ncbi:MAG TPA: ATPase, T2SS/T4P/T4SS family [Candidatus Paceibacterota bacterium]|nr:ATPase, T2SS/T4P/T4SS family [Candidatus Paceibacterota bacterium]